MAKRRFRRLKPDAEVKGLKPWRGALKLKHLSVKTANNEGFKCSQLENCLLLHYLAEENEIKRSQLCLFCLDDNLFENDTY